MSTLPNDLRPALTAEAMRAADHFTIETFGIPGYTLMETAGRGAAECIDAHFGSVRGQTIVVLCGKGNNGGDGFVAARVLYGWGARVHVILLAEEDAISVDAAHNLGLLRRLAEHDEEGRLRLTRLADLDGLDAFRHADVYVDALLGTGITSDLRAPVRDLVVWLNAREAPVVALDVPTGLHTDTGAVLGEAVTAALTVTMGALKTGLLVGEGPVRAGRVEVVDIGIPDFVIGRVRKAPGCALVPTDAAVRRWLPGRAHDAHKYSVGLALLAAGAPGFTGAPVMASQAAARAGSGFVVCACPEPIRPTLAAKLTEVTTVGLPVDETGAILVDEALDAMAERMSKARALLVGPGLGRAPGTQAFVRALLRHTDLPVVLDADGLVALAGHTELLAERARGRWILTPHAGEFKRLAGADVDLTDRVRTAQRFAEQWDVVLLLKGMPSVVAAPDGTAYVNATGNPALATAGTGDVLAGLTVGLLAQGLAPAEAAVAALHLGGAAADRYADHFDPRAMVATDLIDQLPHVLHERFRS